MKRIVVFLFFALSTMVVNAQGSTWTLIQVPNDTGESVGYIYHIYSRGNATFSTTNTTMVAGLRFICSIKDKTENFPIVTIFWGGRLSIATNQEVTITIDNSYHNIEKWTQDGSLLYARIADENTLINALKKGRIVTFTWNGIDSTKYIVAFELKNFNLSEFNNSCKPRI